MDNKNNDDFEMTFENRYKIFSLEKRKKFIDNLYEPYRVRGVREEVLKNSPKYQYPNQRVEGNIIGEGFDDKGYYAIFLPTENEYKKIKIFAKIKDKLVKLSELAKLQRELTERNKSYSELNLIEKKIDELYFSVFDKTKAETKISLEALWFTVGLNFANGTIQQLYEEEKSGAEIAIHLGNKNYRPYITETLGNSTKNDKNIYSSSKKMEIIIDYCNQNKIEVCDEFISVYNSIKPH